MKTRRWSLLPLLFLISGVAASYGQNDSPEVPGDNFSLEGALELFKKSASPEEFEKMLNSPDSKVNNLDLNEDGDIDYIRVIDRNEVNVHAFILQAVVSSTQSQDVAVIELEKLANGKAVLQITGDADIYGTETIIEPTEEVRVNAGTSTAQVVVNVWTWPSVQYVYSPYYNVWVSPWRWAVWPIGWNPWRPVAYYVYRPWWTPYRPYYSVCNSHRVAYAHRMYRPMRTSSMMVYNRHRVLIDRYRSNNDDRSHHRYRSNHYGRMNGNEYSRSNHGREQSDYQQQSNSYPSSSWNNNRFERNERNGRSHTNSDQHFYRDRPEVIQPRDGYSRQSHSWEGMGSRGRNDLNESQNSTRFHSGNHSGGDAPRRGGVEGDRSFHQPASDGNAFSGGRRGRN